MADRPCASFVRQLAVVLFAFTARGGLINRLPEAVERAIPEAESCTGYQQASYRGGLVYVVSGLKISVKCSDGVTVSRVFPLSCYWEKDKTFSFINPAAPEHEVLRRALVLAEVPQPVFFGKRLTDLAESELPEVYEVSEKLAGFDETDAEDWLLLGQLYAERGQETDAFTAFQQAQIFSPREWLKWDERTFRTAIPFSYQEAALAFFRVCEPVVARGYLWQAEKYLPGMVRYEVDFANQLRMLLPAAQRLEPFEPGRFSLRSVGKRGHDVLCVNAALKYIFRFSVERDGSGILRVYQPDAAGGLDTGRELLLQRIDTVGGFWPEGLGITGSIRKELVRFSVTGDTPVFVFEGNRLFLYPLPKNDQHAIALFLPLPPQPFIPLGLSDLRTVVGSRGHRGEN